MENSLRRGNGEKRVMSTEMATGINHGQCRLVFVSRPGQTKTSVPWHLSQCHVQETDLSFAGHHVARDSVATVRPFSISSRHCTVVPSSSRSLALRCRASGTFGTTDGEGQSSGPSLERNSDIFQGRALKEFGPNTFDIMQSLIAQRNGHGTDIGASSITRTGMTGMTGAAQRWVLHEVMHGCLGGSPGNTFSFVIRLEGGDSGGGVSRDDKSVLPGY